MRSLYVWLQSLALDTAYAEYEFHSASAGKLVHIGTFSGLSPIEHVSQSGVGQSDLQGNTLLSSCRLV